ncbi:hypothetical protein DXA48_06725 [Ruminococcus sp. OF02-6]|nr:hypothetical protein DXA48_06725 [Ruminococcus sp. OF02-6]RHR02587.1 hypothetical protein DWX61_16185 [Ruminococcus sp. AF20-12LB]
MFFSILAHFTDDNEKNTIHGKNNWKICQIYQEKLLFFGRITLTNEGEIYTIIMCVENIHFYVLKNNN